MASPRFAKLRAVLLAVSELSPEQRSAHLDVACEGDLSLRAEVESILAQEPDAPTIIRTDGMGELLARTIGARYLEEPGAAHPKQIGPYRIVAVEGEGGMGVVYRAEQTRPIRRQVALKLVRRGMDSVQVIARFESERQALALMDHPHIATMLDAGSDAHGRPYFVMELVRGLPITEFCTTHKQSTSERIHLFLQVCRAVQHAHQKGIIHRDLKPTNLMVALKDGFPVPKVIDFGIAKAIANSPADLTQLTQEGQPVGTLKYMSPEQARGASREIDVRSDVYSLGVIAYELLTGALPYKANGTSLFEQIRVICEEPPRPFETVMPRGRRLDGDLETIVFKALEKRPEDRYQSVASLADDIERHLASQPILARPPSAAYQLRKLIARNRITSAFIAGIAILVISFGIWMSVLYARSAANLRRALQAEREAKQVSSFMVELFEVSHPKRARGDTITTREILDQGARRIETELSEQPVVQARLMYTMGMVYGGIGIYDKSESLLDAALEKTRETVGAGSLQEAEVLTELGRLYLAQGRTQEAETSIERALAIRRSLLEPDDPMLAASLASLGYVYRVQSRTGEAERLLGKAAAILDAEADPKSRDHPEVLNNLAQVYQDEGRFEEAEALFRRALVMREERLPPDDPELATSLNNLASLYWLLGRHEEAMPLAERSLRIVEKSMGPEHPEFAVALVNLAQFNQRLGQYQEAEQNLTRALSIQRKALGPDHSSVAVTLNNLGMLYRRLGRLEEAETALLGSLEIRQRAQGPDHPAVATQLNNLGEIYLAEGRQADAEPLLRRAIAIREAAYGVEDARTSLPVHNLGILRLEQGRYAEAESLLSRALASRERALGPVHFRIAESLEACAELCRKLNRPAEAEEMEARAASMRAELP